MKHTNALLSVFITIGLFLGIIGSTGISAKLDYPTLTLVTYTLIASVIIAIGLILVHGLHTRHGHIPKAVVAPLISCGGLLFYIGSVAYIAWDPKIVISLTYGLIGIVILVLTGTLLTYYANTTPPKPPQNHEDTKQKDADTHVIVCGPKSKHCDTDDVIGHAHTHDTRQPEKEPGYVGISFRGFYDNLHDTNVSIGSSCYKSCAGAEVGA